MCSGRDVHRYECVKYLRSPLCSTTPVRSAISDLVYSRCNVRYTCSIHNPNYNGSMAIGTTPTCLTDLLPRTSRPSQNVGNSLPGTNSLSTPSSVITAIRMTPPDEP